MKNKKSGYYVHAVFIFLTAVFGISSFFIFSDIIGRSLQSVIKLKTDPSFTGGRIAAVFYDPVGDDHGYGGLSYPVSKNFPAGALDLVRYTVHEPVYNAQWSKLSDYWQIDLEFTGSLRYGRNIRIYIDADGNSQGALQTKTEFAEGVEFDASFPWDYVLSIQNNEGTLQSADGLLIVQLNVVQTDHYKKLAVRIPLENHLLQTLYSIDVTRHYVCVGGWSPAGRDGFLDVSESAFTPKLFDILVPDGKTQEQVLSAWNEDTFEVPVLYPVAVIMKASLEKSQLNSAEESDELQKKLELAAAKKSGEILKNSTEAYEAAVRESPQDMEKIAVAAFNAEKYDEAEKLFDQLLMKNPDSANASAYKGSLIALRSSKASPLRAVDMVAESYRYLDRSISLADDPAELITAFLNRGNVSKAVPDIVFGKALQGAGDFLAAGNEFKKLAASGTDDRKNYLNSAASAYCNAAICFEIAGKKEEAGTWFREADRMTADLDFEETSEVRLMVLRYFKKVDR
ncbi:MAG: tetratricopeptide repeat protein [Spirochaetes bacterium]|nr:tetratricopeptide repeat protein [Spirochaetota bacterium]